MVEYPASQAMLNHDLQLGSGMFNNLIADDDGRIDGLPVVVQDDDAAILSADVIHGKQEHPLEHCAQIEGGSQLTADMIKQLKRCAGYFVFMPNSHK
jgi:hypothetical protein